MNREAEDRKSKSDIAIRPSHAWRRQQNNSLNGRITPPMSGVKDFSHRKPEGMDGNVVSQPLSQDASIL